MILDGVPTPMIILFALSITGLDTPWLCDDNLLGSPDIINGVLQFNMFREELGDSCILGLKYSESSDSPISKCSVPPPKLNQPRHICRSKTGRGDN